ncbi:nucleotidyltransferase family protein [Streptomyces natalensis]|uniref:nucleotidyltransferase family protein n=1 Tax=Streptomyces natalensis TaxID=68242 RepID=UPI0007C4DB54|nr:nucleotidyltransferase family protein [Streptomyces natalensis]
MKIETDLLLALARLCPDPGLIESCRDRIRDAGENMDWGFFVDQAARHKVLPLVARHILRNRLFRDAETSDWTIPYWWLYESVYYSSRDRNRALTEEFGCVIRALNSESELRYAIRKGPVLSERLYRDPGLRRMGDMDILVARQDFSLLKSILWDLGYIQGRISPNGHTVQDFSRTTQAFWRMNVKTNDLPFVKMAHREHVESYNIDICFDIFQPLSGSSVDVLELLEQRVRGPVCGELGVALSIEDQFIDLCAHLHKEATTFYYIKGGFDLELLKFLDVALSSEELTRENLWPSVLDRSSRYDADRSLYYALHHTAILYPESVPTTVLAQLRPADCRFLDEYGTFDGQPKKWNEPFLERLFDAMRVRSVNEFSGVPRS